jgi:hypothetical protein
MLKIAFLVSFESSRGARGALGAWFHDVWTCDARVHESWLKISEELRCAFGVVGKILMSRILMELIW